MVKLLKEMTEMTRASPTNQWKQRLEESEEEAHLQNHPPIPLAHKDTRKDTESKAIHGKRYREQQYV